MFVAWHTSGNVNVICKVVINTSQPLARIGFMHLLATNMCVWLHTIIHEIMNEYFHLMEIQSATNGTNVPEHHITAQETAEGQSRCFTITCGRLQGRNQEGWGVKYTFPDKKNKEGKTCNFSYFHTIS